MCCFRITPTPLLTALFKTMLQGHREVGSIVKVRRLKSRIVLYRKTPPVQVGQVVFNVISHRLS